jgi:hypothetical protein
MQSQVKLTMLKTGNTKPQGKQCILHNFFKMKKSLIIFAPELILTTILLATCHNNPDNH